MKKLNIIIARLLVPVLMVSAFILPAKAYEEYYVNHWAYEETMDLMRKGIVLGYSDGSIGLDNSLTAEEFGLLFHRVINYYKVSEDSLHNFETSKYNNIEYVDNICSYINDISLHKIAITRQETVRTILVLIDEYSEDSDILSKANELGLIKGYPDGEYRMDREITRGECFVLIYRMLNTEIQKQPQEISLPYLYIPSLPSDTEPDNDSDINNEANDNSDNNTGPTDPDNLAPTKPVIELNTAATEIVSGTAVRVTAYSTDPESDEITYVWENREEENMIYPVGNNLVRVKAVDSAGNESEWADMTIVVVNKTVNMSYEYIETEKYVTEYETPENGYVRFFNLSVTTLENGNNNCSAKIEVFNKDTGLWETVYDVSDINGVTYNGSVEYGKYIKIRYTYNMPDYLLAEDITVRAITQVYSQ